MTIKWTVLDETARDALRVTDADVQLGSEVRVLADGEIYRAVASGSGASLWNPVTSDATIARFAEDVPAIASTWTPTGTIITNLDSVTPSAAAGQYIRFGSIITASVQVAIDPTSTGTITFRISPPVASAFGVTAQAVGTVGGPNVTSGYVRAHVANAEIEVTAVVSAATVQSVYVHFTYRVV